MEESEAVTEPRYCKSDFEDYLLLVPLPPGSGNDKVVGDLTLAANAEPPLGKFMALLENDQKFKKSMERKRADMKDASPSAYDCSLANIAIRANWTDQEIADLIIFSRFKNGEDVAKALRPDYIPRLLQKVHAGLKHDEAVTSLEEWHAERAQNEAPQAEGDRDRLKRLVRTVLEIDVVQVVQYGRGSPEFQLVTPTESITIATVNGIISEDRFRQSVAIGYHKYIPHFSRVQWRSIAQALLDLIEIVDTGPEGLPGAEIDHWLETYTLDHPPSKKSYTTVVTGNPIRDEEGQVWIYISDLLDHVRRRHGAHVEQRELCNLLSRHGAVRSRMDAHRPDGGHTSRSYWRLASA